MAELEFHNAKKILHDIDVEENNWHAARKKLRDVIEAAEKAWTLLQDLDKQVKEKQYALDGLSNNYNTRKSELDSKLEEAKKQSELTLKSYADKVEHMQRATAEELEKLADKKLEAEAIVNKAMAEQKKVEGQLALAKASYEAAKQKHSEFIKSISGGG